MLKRSEFVEHVLETMRAFGAVEAKSMFGGWGLYHDGLFFALIAQDMLYLKVDEDNRAEFESMGLSPFVYEAKVGDPIVMSYHQAPEEALESPAVMAQWVRSAFGAALLKAAKKTVRPRPPPGDAAKATPPRRPRKG